MNLITHVFRRCCVSISCNKIYISLLSVVKARVESIWSRGSKIRRSNER